MSTLDNWFELLNQRFPQCGYNADWCVAAWYCSQQGEPNKINGSLYITEEEDIDPTNPRRFYVIQRFYDTEDNILELAGPLTATNAIQYATTPPKGGE